MSAKAGDRALSGEPEEVSARKFEIQEDMSMTFKGRSCNIFDGEGKLVEQIGAEHKEVTRKVLAGYQCYVMKATIKFEKQAG